MTDERSMDADVAPIADGELRALLAQGREQSDGRLVRLVTSYLTLRRVTADVIAAIEARDGGAAVARNPLLRRARELSDTIPIRRVRTETP